jgi:hypothetical protein
MSARSFVGYLNLDGPQSNTMTAEDQVRWFGRMIMNEFDGHTWIRFESFTGDAKQAVMMFRAYENIRFGVVASDQGILQERTGDIFQRIMMTAFFSDDRPHNDEFEIAVSVVMESALIPAVGALSGGSGEGFWQLDLDR